MRYLILLTCLAGCSTTWTPGPGSGEFGSDSGQCQAQALSAGAGSAPRQAIYNACMQGKGWKATG